MMICMIWICDQHIRMISLRIKNWLRCVASVGEREVVYTGKETISKP